MWKSLENLSWPLKSIWDFRPDAEDIFAVQVVQMLDIINSRVSLEVKRSLKKIGLHQAEDLL